MELSRLRDGKNTTRNPQSAFELQIGDLVLHGFAPADCASIAAAIEHELGRLFADVGIPAALARGGSAVWVGDNSFYVTPGSDAEAIGTQVALTLYEGISK